MSPIEEAEAILERLAAASPEVRQRLSAYGLVIPQFGIKAGIVIKWGYRCLECNKLALYFVGDRFLDHAGNELDRPPSAVPIDQIPWKQDLPGHLINRHTPCCQHCGMEVALQNRYLRDRLIEEIDTFLASRSESERKLEAMRRAKTMGGRTLADIAARDAQVQAVQAQLAHDFAAHQKQRRAFDVLAPEAKEDLRRAVAAGVMPIPAGRGDTGHGPPK